MPIYEFRCPAGHLTEEVCKAQGVPEHTDCEHCDARAQRVFSRPTLAGLDRQTRQANGTYRRRANPADDLPLV